MQKTIMVRKSQEQVKRRPARLTEKINLARMSQEQVKVKPLVTTEEKMAPLERATKLNIPKVMTAVKMDRRLKMVSRQQKTMINLMKTQQRNRRIPKSSLLIHKTMIAQKEKNKVKQKRAPLTNQQSMISLQRKLVQMKMLEFH
jgi:hypothetical protein